MDFRTSATLANSIRDLCESTFCREATFIAIAEIGQRYYKDCTTFIFFFNCDLSATSLLRGWVFRSGIARVSGDRVILDGTIIKELQEVYLRY